MTVISPPPNPSPGDSDAVTEAKIIARLRFFEAKSVADEQIKTAQASEIVLWKRVDAQNVKAIAAFEKSADKGIEAGTRAEEKIFPGYDKLVNMCEQENARLRIDNEKLRSSRNTRAIITGLLGVGAGFAIGNR